MEQGRWQRRSAARPAEIADAALAEFARRGFAAARMADIAAGAGLSKAALYVYFPTKAELFRAVLAQHVAPRLDQVLQMPPDMPFTAGLDLILGRVLGVIGQPQLRRLARMVIAESGNFPELAVLWRENILGPATEAIGAAIGRGQAAGEVGPGDPRLLAFTILGPLLLGVLWREVFEPSGAEGLDLDALAAAHRAVLLKGLLRIPASPG